VSKITNDCLTRSGTGCFIAEPNDKNTGITSANYRWKYNTTCLRVMP